MAHVKITLSQLARSYCIVLFLEEDYLHALWYNILIISSWWEKFEQVALSASGKAYQVSSLSTCDGNVK